MSAWLRDFRIGWRILAKHPETTAVAVLAMALAIAAASTTFGVVERVLIRPLPFADSDRLATVWQVDPATPENWRPLPFSKAPDWLHQSQSFEAAAAVLAISMTFTGSDQPETPFVRAVSHDYFDILGVQPLHGRTFLESEDQPGATAQVLILSHELWQRRFGGDLEVVGRKVELDGAPWQVVGVLPAGFFNPAYGNSDPPLMWVPLGLPTTADHDRRGGLFVAAKLAPGVSFEQARSELRGLSIQLKEDDTSTDPTEALLVPLAERLVRDSRASVWLLFGAVMLVLLVACANVGNLLLTRGLGRRRELAVRRALGAGTGDLLRQWFAEALVLTSLCAGIGLLVTVWAGEMVGLLAPAGFNIPRFEFKVGGHVTLFTLAVVLICGLVFAVLPALQAAASTEIESSLGAGASRAIGGVQGNRLRSSLMLTEVALSLMLLIAAGLMLRSFHQLQQVDPGYDARDVLIFRTSTRGDEYRDPKARVAFFENVQEALAGLPVTESVGAVQGLPFFSGFARMPMTIEGQPLPEAGREPRIPVYRSMPGYHEAMRIPLQRGRLLSDHDDADSSPVAIVSAEMAEHYWQGEALGAQVLLGGEDEPRRVVGIVGDVRAEGSPPLLLPVVYIPVAQAPRPTAMTFVVRTRGGDALEALPAARQAVWSVDSRMSVYVPDTLEQLTRNERWQPRLLAALLGIFALLTLILAATGIYAVLSFAVSQRTREIGIRMALGARRGNVVQLVLRQGLGWTLGGVVVGLVGAVGLARVLESQLYGVSKTDPATYLVLSLFLIAVAALACWLPARRATRVEPVIALNEE